MSRGAGIVSVLGAGWGRLFCGGTVWLPAGPEAAMDSNRPASTARRIDTNSFEQSRNSGEDCGVTSRGPLQQLQRGRSSAAVGTLSKFKALSSTVQLVGVGGRHELKFSQGQ